MSKAADQGTEATGAGLGGFLAEALAALTRRELLIPAIIALVLLTISNIVVLQAAPAPGASPSATFFVAALVRVIGVIVVAVAILRTLTASDRGRWRPDGAMALYALTFFFGVAISAAVRPLVGERLDVSGLLITNVVTTILSAPLALWFTAIAVARPLAWRPGPWLRDFGRWLPPLLAWTLLLVTPMAVLHAWIDVRLIRGAGDLFWPLALFDGALSTAMALIGLALNAVAYGRVARA